MDPISVIKTLWRHKWVAMPVVVLTIAACVYVMFFAGRSYQASMTYALITPKVPTAMELETSPQLAKVNGDNPYLRSPDNTLLSQVLITKLGAQETAEALQEQGLGAEYTVAQASTFGSGMLLEISASGASPQQAVDTAVALGKRLTTTLHDVQKINGADESYLYSALAVDGPGQAEEMFSSRLRTLIIVAVGGVVLVFGAVSIARSLELARAGRRAKEKPARHAGNPETEARQLPEVQAGQTRRRERADSGGADVDLGLLGRSHRIPVPDREYRT
ncbi:Wzz/FepE/Etk N-terminal domain-containing protein [Arthrobacter sp. ISL-69]|uniref:Wzz/FepE/Etk N-terminal domain-containing protein n=1 Tax=Arthrobacter sp. ISL-69 TaxID=2819113 RepID=UPI001BECC065|nr:Wzz/FepE/Etk N-terminal domain-containing protein [Arthrobacter sp. ISL-69]MBT2537818.1 chain-length determining protein [Arthrobacter sp. ISL-69]